MTAMARRAEIEMWQMRRNIFVMVEALLKRYQDQQALLADVEMDPVVVDDAESVHGGFDTAPFGLTSNTMTHYTFEHFLDQAQVPPR